MATDIRTWRDLKAALDRLSDEQLDQLAQIAPPFSSDDTVVEGMPAFLLATVDEGELARFRSAKDNRRHGNEVVLFVDHNPFTEDGAMAYELTDEGDIPIYPKGHDASADWTRQ